MCRVNQVIDFLSSPFTLFTLIKMSSLFTQLIKLIICNSSHTYISKVSILSLAALSIVHVLHPHNGMLHTWHFANLQIHTATSLFFLFKCFFDHSNSCFNFNFSPLVFCWYTFQIPELFKLVTNSNLVIPLSIHAVLSRFHLFY